MVFSFLSGQDLGLLLLFIADFFGAFLGGYALAYVRFVVPVPRPPQLGRSGRSLFDRIRAFRLPKVSVRFDKGVGGVPSSLPVPPVSFRKGVVLSADYETGKFSGELPAFAEEELREKFEPESFEINMEME
jgi:hypothetical protein